MFIYFSRSASETSLQTSSTASNAVGSNTVLIAVAENGTVDASFYVFGGSGGLKISETNISDDSISTPKLQANSVTSSEILSNTITANEIASNTITASEIDTGTITIGSLSGAGDLAEQNSVNWSTQVSGTGKPENYADKTTATVIGTAMDGTAVITTGIIKDSAENMVIDFDAATIEINSTYGLIVNSSDGIKIDSGGSIVFLGRNDDPGSLVFTGSSGSTASGVDASGAFLCFWPSLAATNNGFAVGYRPTFDGNVSETSFDYISFSGSVSTALIGNNKELRITGSGTESVGNIFPSTTNMYSLGSSDRVWAAIYGDAIYRNGSALDVYDDLYELSQVKSKKEKNEFGEKTEVEKVNAKGLPVIDPLSIPQELTNYDDVVATLKHDNCDLITQADIDEYILDDEEAGWMLKTDFTLLSDLTMGAVRQLDSEVISMFELLSSRITALENGTKAKGA
jgi:hypothetical protein